MEPTPLFHGPLSTLRPPIRLFIFSIEIVPIRKCLISISIFMTPNPRILGNDLLLVDISPNSLWTKL